MGASNARKQKRQEKSNTESQTGQPPAKRVKNNRGRSDYRNVTRTARRGPRQEDEFEEEEEVEENATGSDSSDEDEAGNGADEERGEAYNALLNLLTAEQDDQEESESDSEDDEEEEDESSQDEQEEEEDEEEEEEDENEVAGLVDREENNDESDEESSEDDSDSEDLSDPFEYHFANSSSKYLADSISALEDSNSRWKNTKQTFESYNSITSTVPIDASSKFSKTTNKYNIKSRILEPFKEKAPADFDSRLVPQLLKDSIFSYHDVLFPYGSVENIPDYRRLYALHCLNHVYKTRDKILKNNTKLRIQSENVASGKIKPEDEKEFRDQGFTRPKVLMLLPTRHHCYEIVNHLMEYSGAEQIENQKKFKGQFYEESTVPDTKPDDFRELFEGNTNDFFCLGIKFTRKTMKLYSSFYNSDIILASPIGLQMILEHPDKKKRQTDFLSSIEVFVVDQAHSIEMQNWDHILTVLKYLNKVPKELHDTDFSRVRMWAIEDQAKYFTQSLIFTQYNTPNVNNLLTKSQNIFGKERFKPLISTEESAIFKVGLKIKQIFTRFASTSPFEEPDERFNHFKSVIVPALSKSTSYEDGLLLYIPQYTDFLRIKNYLHNKTSLTFCDINEYSEQKDLTRSRALFQQGRMKILLYTERLHHYRRFELKGVKNILMYGVPTNPNFYTEVVSSIGRSVFEEIADFNISTVRCLYSKWDALALERVVGTKRAAVLTHGQNEFHEFR